MSAYAARGFIPGPGRHRKQVTPVSYPYGCEASHSHLHSTSPFPRVPAWDLGASYCPWSRNYVSQPFGHIEVLIVGYETHGECSVGLWRNGEDRVLGLTTVESTSNQLSMAGDYVVFAMPLQPAPSRRSRGPCQVLGQLSLCVLRLL